MEFETIQSLRNYLFVNHNAQAYGFNEAFESAIILNEGIGKKEFTFDWVTDSKDVITLAVTLKKSNYKVKVV